MTLVRHIPVFMAIALAFVLSGIPDLPGIPQTIRSTAGTAGAAHLDAAASSSPRFLSRSAAPNPCRCR